VHLKYLNVVSQAIGCITMKSLSDAAWMFTLQLVET